MPESKAMFFPKWVEALAVVVLAVMCVVEWRHDQIIWSVLFGCAAILLGVTLVARLKKGANHEEQ